MRAVHQFVAAFEAGAVGQHIVSVQRVLRDWGFASEVFADQIRRFAGHDARRYDDYGRAVPAAPDDLLLYHLAIGSEVATFLAARSEPMAVWYHNVTPSRYFAAWEPALVPGVEWGRAQLRELAPRCRGALADSHFNARELVDLGYETAAVVPILLDLAALHVEPDAATQARLDAAKAHGGVAAVFVGRVVPNKAQHELVKVAAVYRAMYEEPLRVRLVGAASCVAYSDAVQTFADQAGVGSDVELTGGVTTAELAAHYRGADVFVSASEHEGFCVPLLEAMSFGVPIVAYSAGAVPETLGDAGILLGTRAPAAFAAAVHRVVHDPAVRADLRDRGAVRLDDFAPETVAETLRSTLGGWGIAP
jgi:glycosyltransferase involved in cell wall biosynthesis